MLSLPLSEGFIFPSFLPPQKNTALHLKQDSIGDVVKLVNTLSSGSPKNSFKSAEKINKLKRHAITNIESLHSRMAAEKALRSVGTNGIMADLFDKLSQMRVGVSPEDEDDVDISDEVV